MLETSEDGGLLRKLDVAEDEPDEDRIELWRETLEVTERGWRLLEDAD